MRCSLSPHHRWIMARCLAGTALLVAGATKFQDRLTGGLGDLASDLPPRVQLLQAECEIGFGLWLILGCWPVLTRWLALATFSTFTVVSAFNVATRVEDCGCFGSIGVPPGWVLVLDLIIVGALGWSRPDANRRPRAIPILALMVLFWSGVGGFVLADGARSGPRPIELEPSSWVGRRLPVLGRVDVSDKIAHGDWKVVFHRHGCRACEAALPKLERSAHATANDPGEPRTALIEVPPFAKDTPDASQDFPSCLIGHLDPAKIWQVATPSVILVRDGIVVDGRSSFSSHRSE